MVSPETQRFYRPVRTIALSVEEVGHDPTVRTPFATENPLVATAILPEQSPRAAWVQLSANHGRSVIDSRINGKVLWEDKFGTVFGARDRKGAIMDDIALEEDEFSPYGVRVRGLKDDVGLEKMQVVSRVMRKNGLATEAQVRIYKVTQVWNREQFVSVEKWKAAELQRLEKLVARRVSDETRKHGEDMLERTSDYFQSTDFYIVERALQVAERLCDVGMAQTDSELLVVLAPAFRWVNVVARNGIRRAQDPRQFDCTKPDDVKYYFHVLLPIKMGYYLAKLHSLGLVHRYPTRHNWSAVGTLYDLDSVRGVRLRLGDRALIQADYERDVVDTGQAIQGLYLPSDQRASSCLAEYSLRGEKPELTEEAKVPGFIGAAMAGHAFLESYRRGRKELGLEPLRDIFNIVRDHRR